MSGNVKVVAGFDAIKVKFNDILHLHIKRRDLVAVQSWRSDDLNYVIEFTFKKGATTTAEYDDCDNWKNILQALDLML